MNKFNLHSNYQPAGDQPKAIKELVEGINRGDKFQTLLGVTGSGKTFTISNLIQQVQKPTLVISPNKTLAAQLYGEFAGFFPQNAIEYFISYYDYYQPEAYLPKTDTYIEKDFSINDEIDRLRLKATSALVEDRRDVIVIASVSCIYSIGKKDDFMNQLFTIRIGAKLERQKFLYKLADLHYSRNDLEFTRGTFRVRGDIVDILPGYEREVGIRVEFFGNEIEKISMFEVSTGQIVDKLEVITIYPSKIFVTTEEQINRGIIRIREELHQRLDYFYKQEKYAEAERLKQRTLFDLEMMREVGYCSGIENYSMHLSGRDFGERPSCIFDFFPPDDYLLIIDESHVSIPQLRAMYNGDRNRKTTLVEHGFRLPSAIENRPLKFEEIQGLINQVIFVSATPGDWELEQCGGVIVEQIIRPTGLLDPQISVRPIKNQIDDLMYEIRNRIKKKQRTLVTTMTKRMAEDLTAYFKEYKISCQYLHSDVDNFERVEILRELRLGDIDVIVGVNLLREGLDLPEVALVAVLDADKEGFLRSERSLLQIAGRTARNVEGLVIMYADRITRSMQLVIDETNRRRKLQQEYNEANNIKPETIYKSIEEIMNTTSIADIGIKKRNEKQSMELNKAAKKVDAVAKFVPPSQINTYIEELYIAMKDAAKDLDFERAAAIRDEIEILNKKKELSK
ncbi:MAG: excinuclease ABC subunit UvrB [Bacteroidetes bacterium]|nr:excinuclease ABC subunit UvrB [Bacteroidota bacterium]